MTKNMRDDAGARGLLRFSFLFFFFGGFSVWDERRRWGRACRFSFSFLFGLGFRMRDDAGPSVYCFL